MFSTKLISTSVSQLSLAVIALPINGAVGTPSHSTVASNGTPFNVGSVVSSTVIVCVSLTLLPQSSVAVHVLSII